MLRIIDEQGKTKFILKDEDDEPISIDELVLEEEQKEEEENEDAAE